MSALYLHIPFCKRLCGYCDFFKSVKLQQLPQVIEAMKGELISESSLLKGEALRTIYFGGGTPSLLSSQQIAELLEVIASNYDVNGVEEITLEANPDDLTPEYLEGLRAVGINRLSIGIQSFDDDELRFMNRRHTASQAIDAVKRAQELGFDNITIDLIFGVDGFGETTLRQSLEQAIALNVQHISAYHLTIESGTPFGRKLKQAEMQQVSDEQSMKEYALVDSTLREAGFVHYEVSNYALPGFRSKHNSSYWHGVKYLGIGPGAHSFSGTQRRYAVESIDKYLEDGDQRYEVETLTERDHYNELIMTSLRCCEGIDTAKIKTQFSEKYIQQFTEGIEPWLREGKLHQEAERIFIPSRHFLISDMIIESLFDC